MLLRELRGARRRARAGLWQLGGVPQHHRTDHLSAAIRPLDADGHALANARYAALLRHYGMEPTTNTLGVAHENGDVEQAHYRFKEAVDQALRVRGSREFPDRAAYTQFLQALVKQRNLTRQARWAEERAVLRPLPAAPLALCRELRVAVSRFSTIQVLRNTYSVPARLIGATVLVRVRAETLEVYHGTAHLLTLPRLLGHGQHRIDYRHVIWSLVRKPGAFAQYRYRDDLFPAWSSAGRTMRCAPAGRSGPTASTCACCISPPAPPRARSPWPWSCCWTSGSCPASTPCGIWCGSPSPPACRSSGRWCWTWASTTGCWCRSGDRACVTADAPGPGGESRPRLHSMLRRLHLTGMADAFADLAAKAAKADLTHEAFLTEVVRCECVQREQRRVARLLRQSGLPAEKTFRTLQLDRFPPGVRQQVERLRQGAFLDDAVNVVAVGKPGVGKSHLLAALAHELILQGHAVLWTPTANLVQRLLAAKRDLRLPQELKRLDRYACLVLDDIGYVQHDRDEMEVLFTLLAERYERRSVGISTNLVFSDWARIFKDPMTTLAAIDRVVHHSVILDLMGLESYRAQEATAQHAAPRPAGGPRDVPAASRAARASA